CDGRDPQGSPSPSTPIDVRPLPTSPHEPAGGIFAGGRPAERVDRVEETRVELSLVRLLSPGWAGSRGDERSSDRGPATPSSPHLGTGIASPQEIVLQVGPTSSDEPRPFRPRGQPFFAAASGLTRSEV